MVLGAGAWERETSPPAYEFPPVCDRQPESQKGEGGRGG